MGPHDADAPVFVISVAAQLAGMHAQTLRQYDRLGLVTPSRTTGGGRRYSQRDIERLREVQRLSEEGIGLAGVERILALEAQVVRLREQLASAVARSEALAEALTGKDRVFAAGRDGQVIALRPGTRPRPGSTSTALVVWRPPAESARRVQQR